MLYVSKDYSECCAQNRTVVVAKVVQLRMYFKSVVNRMSGELVVGLREQEQG